ncbi:MAG: hypothetical protein DRR00_10545 [Candidatus Parabeggiatoa sp. nov. 3]|nr:MAG: hypothetical protein DRR00_10545 [Gammaproteobacteria bacterium]RKZ65776.1 MAG: hypothetical protein DRQ99_11720 [Gammaproteobacteria bacterium]
MLPNQIRNGKAQLRTIFEIGHNMVLTVWLVFFNCLYLRLMFLLFRIRVTFINNILIFWSLVLTHNVQLWVTLSAIF